MKFQVELSTLHLFLSQEYALSGCQVIHDLHHVIQADLMALPVPPGEEHFCHPFQLPYPNVRTQLLFELPDQRLGIGLPKSNMSPGECKGRIIGSGLQEYPAIVEADACYPVAEYAILVFNQYILHKHTNKSSTIRCTG